MNREEELKVEKKRISEEILKLQKKEDILTNKLRKYVEERMKQSIGECYSQTTPDKYTSYTKIIGVLPRSFYKVLIVFPFPNKSNNREATFEIEEAHSGSYLFQRKISEKYFMKKFNDVIESIKKEL